MMQVALTEFTEKTHLLSINLIGAFFIYCIMCVLFVTLHGLVFSDLMNNHILGVSLVFVFIAYYYVKFKISIRSQS
jgi:hypothetical protein